MSWSQLSCHHSAAMEQLHKMAFDRFWSETDFNTFLNLPTYRAFGWVNAENELLGFALFNIVTPDIELCTICVNPNYRRLGIAEELVLQSLKNFNDFESCFLEVSEINSGAIALYSKLGFKGVGIRKNYYKLPNGRFQNAALMKLDLI